MLSTILKNRHFCFESGFDRWQDAITAGCRPLEDTGAIDASYAPQIIDAVNEYGPYIVIAPLIALPHSQQNAAGVKETAVGFMRTAKPVAFDPDDREKDARLFFTLASQDHEKHLQNIAALAEMLDNDALVNALLDAENEADLQAVCSRFDI